MSIRSVITSKAAFAATLTLLAATGGIVVATRGGTPEVVHLGALDVRPSSLSLFAEQSELFLRNTGATAVGYSVATGADWFFVVPSKGVVPGRGTARVVLYSHDYWRTDRTSLTVSAEGKTIRIPVVAKGESHPPGPGGGGLRSIPEIQIGSDDISAETSVLNGSPHAVTYAIEPDQPWLSVSPAAGTIPPRTSVKLVVTPDRARLDPGIHTAHFVFDAGKDGNPSTEVRVEVGRTPLLVLPTSTLDFGIARRGSKTLPFEIRNDGHAPLTYQVSVDREYITLEGASGTIASKSSAQVKVTYNYDKAYDGKREVPLPITSNGGSATLTVLGITDSIGPRIDEVKWDFKHAHTGAKIFRHLTADLEDDSSTPTGGRVQWRQCRKTTTPLGCADWSYTDMGFVSGKSWQAEIGPLDACTTGIEVFINFRLQADDSLGNHSLTPGSATYFNKKHCG